MDARTRYAKAGNLNVAYQIVGEGPFDLVLSPGAWTHLDLAWDVPPLARFLDRLAERSRLILFDKPGTGLSDPMPPETLPTMEHRMEHLRAVMDAAGSERAVLLGTLGGGAMTGLFAATFPQRTLGLILFGTFGKLEADTGLLARLADSQEVALDRVEAEWGSEGVSLAFWAPSLVGDEAASRAFLRLSRSALSPGSARTLMRLGFQVDWEAVLPSIHVPTLVLHRSGDLVVPVRQGRKLAEAIPGARFVELPGTDHLIWAGDTDPVLAEIDAFIDELRPEERPQRRLCTILFTDIVNSTDTAVRLGDREWRALLAEHHRIVREQLGRSGGREVETTGDGFYALFEGPAAGVGCALDITRAIRPLGIEIRAGVHTGECEVRGTDVGGIAVAIGARVAARAGPSEVLVSSTVRDLVMGSGLSFADRGTHELKGVPGTWTLYAVDDGVPVPTG